MRLKSPEVAFKILAAAEASFATKRFHEVRMEDIALVAQVGKGTIYRYFADKEALYNALLKDASKELLTTLETAVASEQSAKNKLKALVKHSLQVFDNRPHLFDLIIHAEAMRSVSTDFPWQETRFQVIDLAQRIFQEASQSNEFTISDPLHGALQLLGGLRAIIRFGPKPRPKQLSEEIVTHFLHGFSLKT